MRKVMFSVAMSLDGYIARPDGSFDWIPDEPAIDWAEFMGRFDTMLVGRKTFTVTPSFESYPTRTYVFSRTLDAAAHPGVMIVRDRAADVVAELKRESGRDIWLMGGGELFRSMLEAGQVDQVEVAIVPILLGGGLPMLPNVQRSIRLSLTHTRTWPSGIILLTYDVIPEA